MTSRLLAVLTALFVAWTATAATAEEWTVSSEENFPPYCFTEDGKRVGLDVEIIEAVLGHLGVTARHVAVPRNRLVLALDQEETDLAFPFVGTAERFSKYLMVGPFRTGETVFMVRADSPMTFASLEDFRGRSVGTVSGFAYTPEFDAADFIIKEPAHDNLINLSKLVGGRSDAVIGDLRTLLFLVGKAGFAAKVKVLPRVLSVVPRYVDFPRARADHAARFTQALTELQRDGSIDAILTRWRTF